MDDYTDVKQEHILQHIPPYMDDDSGDEHESGDDSKRPRLRLGTSPDAHHRARPEMGTVVIERNLLKLLTLNVCCDLSSGV